jgi:hypothetical protein
MSWKGRARRATDANVSSEETPGNFQLRRVCRYLAESYTGRRQNVFRNSENPMGAAGLSKIRWFPGWSKTLGCRPEASRFAAARKARAREGTSGGESPCDGPGVMRFEGGSRALEPRPWDQGAGAQVPWRLRSSRPLIPQSWRLVSIADERARDTQRCVSALALERARRARTP